MELTEREREGERETERKRERQRERRWDCFEFRVYGVGFRV